MLRQGLDGHEDDLAKLSRDVLERAHAAERDMTELKDKVKKVPEIKICSWNVLAFDNAWSCARCNHGDQTKQRTLEVQVK